MIVFRYLSRQLLQAMAAVTLVLLVVALSGRFIQYLGQAVAGELATDALFLLLIFRLPDFLLVILYFKVIFAHLGYEGFSLHNVCTGVGVIDHL